MKWKNKRASFDYELLEKFEAGIALTGSETKALREGKGSLPESYIGYKAPHVYLFNLQIPMPDQTSKFSKHEVSRSKILLLNKKEIKKMINATTKKGLTIIPLELFWNKKGLLKVNCAIARGKNERDKRESIKQRDWNRQKQAVMKEYKS